MSRIGFGFGLDLSRYKGPPAFNPLNVAGAYSILDANTLSATANLASWPDSVPAGPGATATGTQRPVVNATAANGLPTVQFNTATTTHVMTTGAFSGLTAMHLVMVIRTLVDPSVNSFLWNYNSAGSARWNFLGDGKIYDDFGSTTRHDAIAPGGALNVLNIYEVITTASEWTCKLNGVQLFTTATNTFAVGANNFLGANGTGGVSCWSGDIPFQGIWSSKLSAPDAAYIRNGLKARYGTP